MRNVPQLCMGSEGLAGPALEGARQWQVTRAGTSVPHIRTERDSFGPSLKNRDLRLHLNVSFSGLDAEKSLGLTCTLYSPSA